MAKTSPCVSATSLPSIEYHSVGHLSCQRDKRNVQLAVHVHHFGAGVGVGGDGRFQNRLITFVPCPVQALLSFGRELGAEPALELVAPGFPNLSGILVGSFQCFGLANALFVIASKALTWASAEALPTVACSRMAASSSSNLRFASWAIWPIPVCICCRICLKIASVGFLQQEIGTSLILQELQKSSKHWATLSLQEVAYSGPEPLETSKSPKVPDQLGPPSPGSS